MMNLFNLHLQVYWILSFRYGVNLQEENYDFSKKSSMLIFAGQPGNQFNMEK